jgi:putative endopeptidase
VLALETKLAGTHATREDSEDVVHAFNPWTRADLDAKAPGLDWAAFLAAAHLETQPTFVVWHPSAVTGLAALVRSEPLSTWKEYLALRAIERAATFLPAPLAEEHFAFYGKALTGVQQERARWKRALDVVDGQLGDAVGRLYVARHFPPESKAEIEGMVRNIQAAFARRIDALDWMAPATKAAAKEKLMALRVGIGYPERFRSFEGLEIRRDDALGNEERAEAFRYRQEVAKLGQAPDRDAWCMVPQLVNAVNLPARNSLNFPAAILEPPFYDRAATPAVKYAAIGAIIGHEISHSFDDQGAMFDATGRLRNWWTEADLAHFHEAGRKLAAQYDAYRPFPDAAVNGRLTLSENIADLAGLAAAYDAWKASLGAAAPEVDGLTGDQQFFVSFGQAWKSKQREAALRRQLATDGHAPAPYRALTVRNLDAWYAAFDVKPGQKLYLAPADRVRVW